MKKKRSGIRFLSVFLCLLIFTSVLPVGIFAEPDTDNNEKNPGTLPVEIIVNDADEPSALSQTGNQPEETAAVVGYESAGLPSALSVAVGTELSAIELPSSLRVYILLEETSDTTTVTSTPTAAFAQGVPSDPGLYGYTAPADEAALRESGELVIYTYEGINSTGYRVYGALGSDAESWFVCDETGIISAVVSDIPVFWSSDAYAADIPGNYTFTACSDTCTFGCIPPQIVVTVGEPNIIPVENGVGADGQTPDFIAGCTHEHTDECYQGCEKKPGELIRDIKNKMIFRRKQDAE